MPLTYERDPKVPAAVGNQYPSVQPTNPFPMKDSTTTTATTFPADQYSAPVTGSYPSSAAYDPSTTSMHGSSAMDTSYGIAPGSTYGQGATTVQGTGIVHDEHIRDRTIPGQGVTYEILKEQEKQNKERDNAFVVIPEGGNCATVNPKIEGLASDPSGRYDGFVAGPDGINSRTTTADKAAHGTAAAAAATSKTHDKHDKHDKHARDTNDTNANNDMNDTNETDANGQKKGKIGQFISNLTHKHNTPEKDPMHVYQDSLAQQGSDPSTSSSTTTSSTHPAHTTY